MIPQFDGRKVSDDGVADTRVPKIDFLIEFEFVPEVTGKGWKTEDRR